MCTFDSSICYGREGNYKNLGYLNGDLTLDEEKENVLILIYDSDYLCDEKMFDKIKIVIKFICVEEYENENVSIFPSFVCLFPFVFFF